MSGNPQYIDYEIGCKRCGKCCGPLFEFKEKFVRFKRFKCKYLGSDNLCTIYNKRKEIMGCFSPHEMPEYMMPESCIFGGKAKEIDGKEADEFILNPSLSLVIAVNMNLFNWR